VHGSLTRLFRNDVFEATRPVGLSQGETGQTFDPINADSKGVADQDSLSRQQYGWKAGLTHKKDKRLPVRCF